MGSIRLGTEFDRRETPIEITLSVKADFSPVGSSRETFTMKRSAMSDAVRLR
jgi:hypothetical protein